jgi:hypothetical protein
MEEESLDQSMPWRLACFWVLGEIDEPGGGARRSEWKEG